LSTSAATPRAASSSSPSAARASPSAAFSSSACGQLARWTEPSCHHDQTSSATNGRNGASRRWKIDSERRSARLTDAEGRPLSYNRAAIRHGALAAAPIALLPAMIAALRPAVTSRTAGNVSA